MKYIFSIIIFLLFFSCSDQEDENIQTLFGVSLFDKISNYLNSPKLIETKFEGFGVTLSRYPGFQNRKCRNYKSV